MLNNRTGMIGTLSAGQKLRCFDTVKATRSGRVFLGSGISLKRCRIREQHFKTSNFLVFATGVIHSVEAQKIIRFTCKLIARGDGVKHIAWPLKPLKQK